MMRRFFTLTLLSALSLTAGNSSTARQRAAVHVAQEARAERSYRGRADESFARANREASKLTGRLGTDRRFADKFFKAARAHDRARTDALLRGAGIRGAVKVEVGSEPPREQAHTIITICDDEGCVTIIFIETSEK